MSVPKEECEEDESGGLLRCHQRQQRTILPHCSRPAITHSHGREASYTRVTGRMHTQNANLIRPRKGKGPGRIRDDHRRALLPQVTTHAGGDRGGEKEREERGERGGIPLQHTTKRGEDAGAKSDRTIPRSRNGARRLRMHASLCGHSLDNRCIKPEEGHYT